MNRYKKDILSNKSTVLTISNKAAKTATALFMFKTGSRYENKNNNGISHFLEHMFFKGSSKYPDTLSLSSALDALGCEFNAFTGKEYTGYYVKVAENKLGKALDILGDMILTPKLDAREIEREKGVIIEEVNMYENNPMMHIDDVLENCIYGDTPAGWDTLGTRKNIKKFKKSDFVFYLKNQYGSESVNLILAGNISDENIKRSKNILKKFKSGNYQNQVGFKGEQARPQIEAIYKDVDQLNLALAVRTFPINHEDEFKVKLLALILGGAMSSRLFINLREKKSLAYYIKTSAEFYSDSGYLSTQAGVPTSRAKEAVKIILREYKKLKRELVPENELKRAKEMLEGRVMLQMEATDNIASWYGRQEILRQDIISPSDFLNEIRKITASDLQKTAKKIFANSNLNLAAIGKVKNKDFEDILRF